MQNDISHPSPGQLKHEMSRWEALDMSGRMGRSVVVFAEHWHRRCGMFSTLHQPYTNPTPTLHQPYTNPTPRLAIGHLNPNSTDSSK